MTNPEAALASLTPANIVAFLVAHPVVAAAIAASSTTAAVPAAAAAAAAVASVAGLIDTSPIPPVGPVLAPSWLCPVCRSPRRPRLPSQRSQPRERPRLPRPRPRRRRPHVGGHGDGGASRCNSVNTPMHSWISRSTRIGMHRWRRIVVRGRWGLPGRWRRAVSRRQGWRRCPAMISAAGRVCRCCPIRGGPRRRAGRGQTVLSLEFATLTA